MGQKTVYEENVFFKPMQFLYGFIQSQVPDPNAARAALPTPKERQWIFPNTPEANDEFYPRVAIIPGSVSVQEYGAGRYIETVTDSNGDWVSETRGVIANVPVTIGVFVKKKQTHTVDDFGVLSAMQNTKLSDYLAYQFLRALIAGRSEFIAQNMDFAEEPQVTDTYEDNEFLYATEVTFTLRTWLAIEEQFSPADLIRQISLDFTVTQ